ncbi:MAG TPA: hypothetical protein VGB31_05615 [Myxococcota bacterium]
MISAAPKLASKTADAQVDGEVAALFTPIRREQRSDEIRSAEYTPFPRARASQTPRRGFSRDVSPLGMCLGVDVPERIGALLRIEVQRLDGQSIGATIGRVVWCKATRDGRYWIGLDLLCELGGVHSKWHRRVLEEQD